MFKSRARSVNIPQAEHARLSGIIANAWGNAEFDVPEFSLESFVKGVTFHDRGYGRLDNYPLGELSEKTWLEIHQRSADVQFSDTQAELVVQLQLKRLVAYNLTPERKRYVEERETFIQQLANSHGLQLDKFVWADHITHFCDNVSFDFCFEETKDSFVMVFKRYKDSAAIDLKFSIKANGVIEFDPWPLNCPKLESFIVGYSADKYPQTLEPVMIPIRIKPKNG